MLNTIAIMGRLTHTPELRTTTSGKEVCSFDIACERSYSANGQRETDFLPCVAWGKTAQFIAQYFSKGSMIDAGFRRRLYGYLRTACKSNLQ